MDTIFEVQRNDQVGRYGVALKNLCAGDVIVDETPFARGPKSGTPIVCLACCCPIDYESKDCRCPLCQWPLCKNCWYANVHSPECEVFTNAKAMFSANIDSKNCCPQLECVTPLRVLLKKETDPERWAREVEPMEYHDEARRQCQDTWNADLINIAKYLRGPCKLSRFSEELIMRVIGILQVNAFEAKTPQGYPMRCLFPQTGILAHNCVPNTGRTIYPSDNYRIKLRALVDIKKDSELFVSYTYVLDGTEERQQHLKQAKYFVCHCQRCTDPTELGTYFSSLKCKECDSGYLTVLDPFDKLSDWKCNECKCLLSSNDARATLSAIQVDVNAIEEMPFNEQRLEFTERMHGNCSFVLHPRHYIQTSLRQNLIQMYGRVKGYELSSLPEFLLEYKIELCKLILNVLDIFEPGVSRSRAAVLYEMHAPTALLAQKLYLKGIIDTEQYKTRLEDAISVLQEAVNIFQHADPISFEGMLAMNAKQGLEHLRATLNAI